MKNITNEVNNSKAPKTPPVNKFQSMLNIILIFLAINIAITIFIKPKKQEVPKQAQIEKTIVNPTKISHLAKESLKNTFEQKIINVNTKTTKYSLDNAGAKLTQASLFNYKDKNNKKLNIINEKIKNNYFFRLATSLKGSDELDYAIYKVDQENPQQIKFSYLTKGMYYDNNQLIGSKIPKNLLIEKKLTFTEDYNYKLEISICNKSKKAVLLNHFESNYTGDGAFAIVFGPGLKLSGHNSILEHGYLENDNIVKVKHGFFKNLFKGESQTEKPIFVEGNKDTFYLGEKYFANIIFPKSELTGTLFLENKEDKSVAFIIKPTLLNHNEKLTVKLTGYLGPKEYNILAKMKPELLKIIGFNRFLGIPLSFWLFKLLNFIYSLVGNYGLAIIILSIITKLIFFPITSKGFKSMHEMQKITPEMNKIKEKYKDNQQKQNEEIMKLYKKYKVNPFGGCLPLILQIPIFFSLFSILQNSIALKGQPFISLPFKLFGQQMWIVDLSVKDPTYILLILMGLSMFIQQKMSMPKGGATGNDVQSKMLLFMPLIFTFMFMNFPAGLVLYWLTNNILTIAHQYYVTKNIQ